MKKGQMSVEFFLLVGFILVLLSVLVTNADEESRKLSQLEKASLCKNAVDSIGYLSNYAALQGTGTLLKKEVFVPKNSVCFLVKQITSKYYLACDLGLQGRLAYSDELIQQPTVSSQCQDNTGWLIVSVQGTASGPSISCQMVS
jgi:hypothetical protein